MPTTNYNLPTISGNMAADVVRDMNALAEATDTAIKDAVDGIDLTNIEQDISDVDSRFTQHSNNQQIHVTQAKQNNWDAAYSTTQGRLGRICKTITNWNDATENGFYMAQGASNAPTVSWCMGTVITHADTYIIQKVMAFTEINATMREFERSKNNGVWEPWIETSPRKLFQSVSSGKSLIANAITGKGVSTAVDAEFATMASNIRAINTGKKFAQGVGSATSQIYSFRRAYNNEVVQNYALTVNGLDFKPRLILALDANAIYMYQNYLNLGGVQTGGVISNFTVISVINSSGVNVGGEVLIGTGGDGYVDNGGFRIPARSSAIPINWIAIE